MQSSIIQMLKLSENVFVFFLPVTALLHPQETERQGYLKDDTKTAGLIKDGIDNPPQKLGVRSIC